MKVIPAIDIIDGKVTRLTKGNFDNKREYLGSPVDWAIKFNEIGFSNLHIVDLNASVSGNITIKNILVEIKKKTGIKIQFGGGIKNLETAKVLLDCGVDKLIIGSISVTNKDEFDRILNEIPIDKIIIAVDVKDSKVAIKGWRELSEISLMEHIEFCKTKKLNSFLCTDISKDGMLKGTNIELYKDILKAFPDINLIASGGVSTYEDLILLESIKVPSVVVGKAIYENRITLEELKKFA
jgi:phosphoribosylformimino-5-aminoimidazole carboxamide ribotide isomerase